MHTWHRVKSQSMSPTSPFASVSLYAAGRSVLTRAKAASSPVSSGCCLRSATALSVVRIVIVVGGGRGGVTVMDAVVNE